MIQWEKLYLHVEAMLKKQLKPHLTYHNWEHTMYVMRKCEHICDEEAITDHERMLIKTAALFHDTGFITASQGHEELSVVFAEQQLPQYGYTDADITKIAGMIRATIIPQKPHTALENILADADLYYLGTDDFERIGNYLYSEMKYFTPTLTGQQWNQIQISFLQSHHYHTHYCIGTLSKKKGLNLKKLMTVD